MDKLHEITDILRKLVLIDDKLLNRISKNEQRVLSIYKVLLELLPEENRKRLGIDNDGNLYVIHRKSSNKVAERIELLTTQEKEQYR